MIPALATLSAAWLCLTPIVHDGDTIRCGNERVRLANIDAPELAGSPRCAPERIEQLAHGRNPAWCDDALAEQSRAALTTFLASGQVSIRSVARDRYGRLIAYVSVAGTDAGEYLMRTGLARRWR
jgi:micrococcal nuclease